MVLVNEPIGGFGLATILGLFGFQLDIDGKAFTPNRNASFLCFIPIGFNLIKIFPYCGQGNRYNAEELISLENKTIWSRDRDFATLGNLKIKSQEGLTGFVLNQQDGSRHRHQEEEGENTTSFLSTGFLLSIPATASVLTGIF